MSKIQDRSRVEAFKSAMLNTVVRAVRGAFEGLTLTNCMESEEFRAALMVALNQPLLSEPVEPAMRRARMELMYELEV